MGIHTNPPNMSAQGYTILPSLMTTEILQTEPQTYQNDNLDDVFGSAPSSPGPFGTFEDSNSYLESDRNGKGEGNKEISDIPRLREKHETEGYRDGVTKGKAQTVQEGFDEGYTLGAVLGLKIGRCLGLLEGLLGGVRAGEKEMRDPFLRQQWKEQRERLEGLIVRARGELKMETVFGREYWGEGAIWKWDVPGEKGEGVQIVVVFEDVAHAHPLIKKWESLVGEELERWGVNMHIMDNVQDLTEETGHGGKTASGKQAEESMEAPGAKKELRW